MSPKTASPSSCTCSPLTESPADPDGHFTARSILLLALPLAPGSPPRDQTPPHRNGRLPTQAWHHALRAPDRGQPQENFDSRRTAAILRRPVPLAPEAQWPLAACVSRNNLLDENLVLGSENARRIQNAAIILGILVSPRSQKRDELERMTCPNAFSPRIRAVRLCVGSSEAEVLQKYKDAVHELLG